MLNIVYAQYVWPENYMKWINDSALRENPKFDGSAYPEFWFYIPEFSERRQQLEVVYRFNASSHTNSEKML